MKIFYFRPVCTFLSKCFFVSYVSSFSFYGRQGWTVTSLQVIQRGKKSIGISRRSKTTFSTEVWQVLRHLIFFIIIDSETTYNCATAKLFWEVWELTMLTIFCVASHVIIRNPMFAMVRHCNGDVVKSFFLSYFI